MLNNRKIEELIKKNEISISVSFEKIDEKIRYYQKEKDILSSTLKNNLYSDRLKLTMGPIIRVLNNKYIKSQYKFKLREDCYDLRQSNDKYIINPGESIIVLTNERIRLNGKYACLIVPRISLSDVGIIVTTAYIDAFYDGIMRLHLSNLSDKPYELSFLEAIAQCFFFELPSSVSEEFKDKFSSKSVFFGQTWKGILESDRNPFPTKKSSYFINKFKTIKENFSLIWSFVKKNSLIFLFITNFVVIVSGYVDIKDNLNEYITITKQVKNIFQPSSIEIIIEPGKIYGEKEIIVECSKEDIISILCNSEEISYKIISGSKENETKILFSTTLSQALVEEYQVNFTYTVIKRVE